MKTFRRGVRNIKEVVTFDEEELTEEILQARVRSTTTRIDTIVKHQKKVAGFEEKLEAAAGKDPKKLKEQRKLRWSIGREHVYINRIIREFKYTNAEKKRLLDKVNKTVDAMRTLERQIKLPRGQVRRIRSPKNSVKSTSGSRRTAGLTSSASKQDAGISYC